MGLVLLKFDNIGEVREKRTMFTSSYPWAPRSDVWLENKRIYAVYKAGDGVYVVYETEKYDYYKYYLAPKVPEDAELVPEFKYRFPQCPKCGSKNVYVDTDEMFCNDCEFSDFWNYGEEVVYSPKEFDWSEVTKREPVKSLDEKPVITAHNAKYFLKQFLEKNGYKVGEIKSGHILSAGHYCAVFYVELQRLMLSDLEVEIGVAAEEWSSWDEIPSKSNPGIYAQVRVDKEVFFAKLKDLEREDLEKLDARVFASIVIEFPELLDKCRDIAEKRVEELAEKESPLAVKLAKKLGYSEEKIQEVKERVYRKKVERAIDETLAFIKDPIKSDYVYGISFLKDHEDIARKVAEEKGVNLDKLLEDYDKAREKKWKYEEELRKKEEARKIKKMAKNLLKRKPSWADGVYVHTEVYRGEDADVFFIAYPVKKSKYGRNKENRYYCKPKWRPVTKGYSLEPLADTLILPEGVFEAEATESEKYILVKKKRQKVLA